MHKNNKSKPKKDVNIRDVIKIGVSEIPKNGSNKPHFMKKTWFDAVFCHKI